MRRPGWTIGLAAVAALQIALLASCGRLDDHAEQVFPVRVERRTEPGHDFRVERFGGEIVHVRARAGGYQLVHFWATWCPPCRKELPALIELSRRRSGRIQVWAISADRDWSEVKRFLGARLPSLIVRDANGDATRAYGVTELPDSYLLDPQGRIRARFSGAQNWSSPEMDRALEQLMQEVGS